MSTTAGASAPEDDDRIPRGLALWAAGFCALTWVGWWLAFWPAMMTEDSLGQWWQMRSWQLTGQQPPFHTMLVWLVTRVWLSPAAVALAQILGLATVFGAAVRELQRWRVPGAPLFLLTCGFGLSPVNGLMAVTLWKDVAYAIVLLGIFVLTLRAVRTNGTSLTTPRGTVALVAALASLALLRHNGPLVAVLLVAGLVIVWPRLWRSMGRVALAATIAVALFRGPFESAVGVGPTPRYFVLANHTHQIAAMLHDGATLTPQQTVLLSAVMPLDAWRDTYDCFSVMPTYIRGADHGIDIVERRWRPYLRAYWDLATRHPWALVKRQACVSSLVWSVSEPPGSPFFAFHPGIVEVPDGPRSDSKLPGLRDWLLGVANWTVHPQRIALTWRPALYLYLTVACVGALVWRSRRTTVWALLLPTAAQSIVLVMLNTVQDFRFQYGVYLIGLVALTLPWAQRRTNP